MGFTTANESGGAEIMLNFVNDIVETRIILFIYFAERFFMTLLFRVVFRTFDLWIKICTVK